jgi:hypothetical protein
LEAGFHPQSRYLAAFAFAVLRLFHSLLNVCLIQSVLIAGRRYGLTTLFLDDESKTKSRRDDFRMRPKTMIRLLRGKCRVGVMEDE